MTAATPDAAREDDHPIYLYHIPPPRPFNAETPLAEVREAAGT